MKKLFTFAAIILLVVASNAQFKIGKNTAGIIIGYGGGLSGYGGSIKVPPIGIEYNFMNFTGEFGEKVQAGIFAGYTSSGEDFGGYGYNWSWTYTHITIMAQGNYHFSPGEKFDPFAGVSVGYDIGSSKYTGPDLGAFGGSTSATVGGFLISGQAGFNYWFSPGMAVQLRVGYFPYIAAGLTFAM